MRNLQWARWLIAAGVLGVLVILAGCAATDAMWYDTGPSYGYVYTRPGTSVYYYDYSYPYGYYDPWPYGSFGFGYYGGHRHHERFEHHGGRGGHVGGRHR